jgi:hypothetical protein
MSSTTEQKKELVEGIREYLLRNETYTFRPTKIDGTNVYIVIYHKFKVVNIESIFVQCKVNINSFEEVQNYSLYHFEYKTLEKAIERIEMIKKEYKIYNGELVDATVYKLSKLEESIIPFSEEEKCCVCFENTSDITLCNHSICLTCRESSIINNHFDCPMCRKSNAMYFYNNKNNLINNEQFALVKRAIHCEKIALPSNRNYHIETSPSRRYYEESEDEYNEATENQQENIVRQQTENQENENEENQEEHLEIVEWIISREPAFVFRPSTQIEDGEIIEDDRMDVDTYDEGSIMNPITIDDLMRNQ